MCEHFTSEFQVLQNGIGTALKLLDGLVEVLNLRCDFHQRHRGRDRRRIPSAQVLLPADQFHSKEPVAADLPITIEKIDCPEPFRDVAWFNVLDQRCKKFVVVLPRFFLQKRRRLNKWQDCTWNLEVSVSHIKSS